MSFQHVSGEYFLIFIRWLSTERRPPKDDFEFGMDTVSKAEFRLGEDGQVKEMGVLLEWEMGDTKIWFKRAGDENSDAHERRFAAGSSAVRTESSQGTSGVERQRTLFSASVPGLAPLFA